MSWVSQVRQRPLYKEMKIATEEALQNYWECSCSIDCEYIRFIKVYEDLILSSFRLLKYIRAETTGLIRIVDNEKIKDINNIAGEFYCLTEGSGTSFQDEYNVLEILSRSAYNEMKTFKQAKEMLESNEE